MNARVIEESDTQNGWTFVLEFDTPDARHFELHLAWVDHDHLTGGVAKPSALAEAIATLAYEALGGDLPARADAAGLRRRIPGFEDLLNARFGSVG